MKKTANGKRVIAVLLALVLCLNGWIPMIGYQTVKAEEPEECVQLEDDGTIQGGTVYASIEKFTIGQGYLIEPTEVSFEAGETYADIIEKLLKENGYTYDVTNTGMGFYLAEIDHADSGVVNIPNCILQMEGNTLTNEKLEKNPYKDTNGLGEFSYSKFAGWYYFVNNKNPGVGMDSTKAKDGDVVRYQFTVYGFGADLGDELLQHALKLPNKDSITKNLALMRQILAKDDEADEEGVYQTALNVVSDMDSTQEQFDQAEQSISTWLAEYLQKKEERDKENQKKVDLVIEKINAIPAVDKLTLEDQKQVAETRTAYDALTTVQKGKVTNLDVLVKAEAQIKVLQDAKKAAQEKAEKEQAEREKAAQEAAAKEAALQKKYTPAKTTLRSIKNAGKSKVRLAWKKVSGATGYEIYRSTKKNGTYKKIKTISKNKTVSFVTKLPKKKGTYYFKVRTYRKAEGKIYYGKDSAVKSRKVK